MKKQKIILFFILLSFLVNGQEKNIIPNPGFESFSNPPLGWFYNGNQFTRLMKFWYSPSQASPDVFGPGVVVPQHWQKKGFGEQKPIEGKSMIGLTLYGCAKGKPHCREYAQIRLAENLVPGQKYKISYQTSHLSESFYINKIGLLFTTEAIKHDNDEIIEVHPHLFSEEIIKPATEDWEKINFEYTADKEYEFITIGNFFVDADCLVDSFTSQYPYAYYYFDDLKMEKVPPIIKPKIAKDDLSLLVPEVGQKVKLKNIYFDLDKCELLPRSHIELQKLYKLLENNDGMTIEVHGHTDIQGTDDYNIKLSISRATAVKEYLIFSGINENRISIKGFGSTQPIAENTSESGRQLNRRVEFLITSL